MLTFSKEQDSQEHLKKLAAFFVVLSLTGFLLYSGSSYFGGIVSALILFTLFRPLQNYFTDRLRLSENIAASLTMMFSFFAILTPLVFFGVAVSNMVSSNVAKIAKLIPEDVQSMFNSEYNIFGFNIQNLLVNNIEKIATTSASFTQELTVDLIAGLSNFLLQLVIAYFILYFLLVDRVKLAKFTYSISPFKKNNTIKLLSEFHNQAFVNIVGAAVNAFIQGSVLALGLWIFGISDAIFWGFMGAVLSFLPVVGMPVIWVPASIYLFTKGDIFSAIGLAVWGGALITIIDNALRLFINKKIGDIHPIITLMGVLIGLPLFGILGLVLGPLMLSYFVLILGMYKEEYIED